MNLPSTNSAQIIQQMQLNALSYQNPSVADCFHRYADYFAPQGNLIVLVKNESIQAPSKHSLLLYVTILPRSDDWAKNMWAASNGTQEFVMNEPPDPVMTWFLGPPR